MELDYFISQSSRAASSQKDTWLYNSSPYDPSVITRSFTKLKGATLTGISGNSNFSLFFTLERKTGSAGSLLSNYTATGGFSIGYTDNNELFVYSASPSADCFYFPEIRLSKKNCLGIVKSNSRITVLNYDLNSRDVYQVSSRSFSPTTNLDGGNFSIGYHGTLSTRVGISGVSGLFDQMVCFNSALDKNDALTIFSGFLDIAKSSTVSYSRYYYEDSLEINPQSLYTEDQLAGFKPFLNYLSTGMIPVATGNFTASISGTGFYFSGGPTNVQLRIVWSGYHQSGESINCYSTGVKTYSSGQRTGLVPFTNNTLLIDNNFYASMNDQSERLTSHLVSFYPESDPTQVDFFSYNIIEKYRTETVSTFSENTGGSYKSGFYRDGVLVNELFCNLMTYPDKNFSQVGIRLPYDVSNKRFLTTEDFSAGYNVYWGYDKLSTYSISGNYIETSEVDENNTYRMIFDKATRDPSYIHTNYGFATGLYPIGTAVVLGGETAMRSSFRIDKRDFWETSSLHLVHAKRDVIVFGDLQDVYIDNELNWTDTMEPFINPSPPA